MRFILLLATLLSSVQLYAQFFSDSTLMNYNTQVSRSEIVVGDRESATKQTSKYIEIISDWSHPTDNRAIFESKFTRPFSWIGRQIYLRVEGASMPYTVRVNGEECATVLSGSMPTEINITKASVEGRNSVSITLLDDTAVERIEGWMQSSVPSLKEVVVMSQPTQMVRDVAISTSVMGESLHSIVDIVVKSHALSERTSTIHYALYNAGGEMVTFGRKGITQSMRGEDTLSFSVTIPRREGWSAENPNLFELKLKTQHEGRYLEYQNYKVGFRAVEVDSTTGDMSINGLPVVLEAKRVEGDKINVESIKSQGFNAIRVAAGSGSDELYAACDSVGLYVIAPMPISSGGVSSNVVSGDNPSNNPKWWGAYMQRVDQGYYTSQLNGSVVAFSVADSSGNGYNMYESYLRLKAKEESRPVVYFEAGGEWNSDKLNINLK
ncbi:MAG: glycoside hydrolase family 2 TIM barrel-domain containing protein [Rikenellaceae bacterium]